MEPNISMEGQFTLAVIIIALGTFDMVMKGISLYRAGTRREVTRFVFLFILNTCGILPIIYLLTHKKVEE